MKSFIKALALISALALLAGCSGTPNEADDSETAPPAVTEPAEKPVEETPPAAAEIPTETPGEAPVETPAANISDYVIDGRTEQGQYTDEVGNSYNYSYVLPNIIINSGDARDVNAEIVSAYGGEIDMEMQNMKDGYSLALLNADYTAAINGDILSILIEAEYDWGYTGYTAYNFRISSGAAVNYLDVIAQAGFSEEEYYEKAGDAAKKAFTDMYGREDDISEDMQDFYQAQLENTLSANDFRSVYIDGNGQLYVLADIYALAGADSYPGCLPVE